MDYEKDEKTRMKEWLIKMGKEKSTIITKVKKLSDEVGALKSDHKLAKNKLELLNDIDNKGKRDQAKSVFQNEIEVEIDELRINIEAKTAEKDFMTNKIDAIDILFEASKLF